MSSVPITIALDEVRYWKRSKLAIAVLILAMILATAAVALTTISNSSAAHEREHLQHQSEQAFLEQPDRHPHRMVHYGHYVFRTPPPLGTIDPGVDAYTGTSIFLEGHRQNSATFSAQQQSSGLTRFGFLTPAFVMQVLAPLLLILIGYSVVTRERESGTIDFLSAQGVSHWQLLLGKGIALLGAGFLMLIPLAVGSLLAIAEGESSLLTAFFLGSYVLYVLVWILAVLLVSKISQSNVISFGVLISSWILVCLLVPRIASSTATTLVALPGKLETDFAVLEKLRTLGDGHNASDPAFNKLKANLLAQYDVDTVEELPVNFRGVVAQTSEAQLTEVLNSFAENRMQEELHQANIARQFGWLSPVVAIRTLSMQLAGTDLETHHRFLREAEQLRFDFVQALNKAHVEHLDYDDDVSRYRSQEAFNKARVDASHWQVLNDFEFQVSESRSRLTQAGSWFAQLFSWLFVLLCLLGLTGRKAK